MSERTIIDYEAVAAAIGDRIISAEEIRELTGAKGNLRTVIDTLSINYTLMNVIDRKHYRMLKPIYKE